MSPAKAVPVSRFDLFELAAGELDKSVSKPNILNYGERDYPEQMRFHKSCKPGRFISGGNRGGKTDAEVVEAIWWASNTHPYLTRPTSWGRGPLQLRIVVVDVAKGIEQIMLPKFKRWMTRSMMVDGDWSKSWDAKNFILTFSNGSTIDFLTYGMDLEKHGGVPRHIIFFDEEPPRHIFNESMARLWDFKGWWVIAATPVKGMGWTFDLLWEPAIENPDGFVETYTLTKALNPWIDDDPTYDDFYTMSMDDEERDMRENGSFVARQGLIFPMFSVDTHVISPPEIRSLRNWEWYTSVDVGLHNPTAWLWHAVSPTGDIVTFAEHYASEMTVPMHAAVVIERESGFALATGGKTVDMRVGDPAMNQRSGITGTSYTMEYAMRGLDINFDGIPRSVEIGIEKMQQYFQLRSHTGWGENRPKWVISSNCPNFIREMKKLRWAEFSSEKLAYNQNKQETVHKKDDHAFDSARYFATLMPDLGPSMEELSVGDKMPTTLSYQDMLVRMAQDDTIEYVDNQVSEPEWDISYSDDYYEGSSQ